MSIIFYALPRMVVETAPVFKFIRNYPSKSTFTYEDSIRALNSLQSNASVLQQSKTRAHNEVCPNLDETRKYMSRCGISMNKLNSLSVIHVAGTKGKGTTCAMCESILRSNGYRTGFYSSPHLVNVTERIRLCGKPIKKDLFAKYFETVYRSLEEKKEHSNDMPPYFKFLTLLAFKIFISEAVDVAIIEVGIGGEHDCTNVLRNVSTIGITSLALEHTGILGDTIEQIAWQKSGIMKPGSAAFTVPQQYVSAMRVLENRAQENNIPLKVVPDYTEYKFAEQPNSEMDAEAQRSNMSLAIQLAHHWMTRYELVNNMKNHGSSIVDLGEDISTVGSGALMNGNKEFQNCRSKEETSMLFDVNEKFARGLSSCTWLGRFQIINKGLLRFYLDGAHTVESLDACVEWFKRKTRSDVVGDTTAKLNGNARQRRGLGQGQGHRSRALVFNATGDRDSRRLLARLAAAVKFREVAFVPNAAHGPADMANKDQQNHMIPLDEQMRRCHEHRRVWRHLVTQPRHTNDVLEEEEQEPEANKEDHFANSEDHAENGTSSAYHLRTLAANVLQTTKINCESTTDTTNNTTLERGIHRHNVNHDLHRRSKLSKDTIDTMASGASIDINASIDDRIDVDNKSVCKKTFEENNARGCNGVANDVEVVDGNGVSNNVDNVRVFDSVQSCLDHLKRQDIAFDVLITGSLHLIGAALLALNHDSSNG